MILIGSRAIKHWFPDFPREPKDYDYIVDDVTKEKPVYADGRVEFHLNPILFPLCDSSFFCGMPLIPDHLYTLKISHLFWDINWAKHMFDVQFLKKKGCVLNKTLFDLLYEYWTGIHGKIKKSDLTLSSKEFFDNALKEYDHDYLHLLFNPIPTYTKVLKEGSEVEPDENKFLSLSHEEKLSLVREEVYVMAFERLGGRDYRTAYAWMLKKFIRNHAPIWEALWIIDNYIELHLPIINYKEKLNYDLQRNHERNIR
jgi:hypothetical protein